MNRRAKLILIAAAIGLLCGFGGIVLQEHHHMPWGAILLSAPMEILAGLILPPGETRAWSIIVGTAVLFAVYAGLLTEPRLKYAGGWIVGFHLVCAVVVLMMRQASWGSG